MSSQQHWPEFKAQKANEAGPQRPKTGVQKRLGGRSSGKKKAKQAKQLIRLVVRIVSHKPIVNQWLVITWRLEISPSTCLLYLRTVGMFKKPGQDMHLIKYKKISCCFP